MKIFICSLLILISNRTFSEIIERDKLKEILYDTNSYTADNFAKKIISEQEYLGIENFNSPFNPNNNLFVIEFSNHSLFAIIENGNKLVSVNSSINLSQFISGNNIYKNNLHTDFSRYSILKNIKNNPQKFIVNLIKKKLKIVSKPNPHSSYITKINGYLEFKLTNNFTRFHIYCNDNIILIIDYNITTQNIQYYDILKLPSQEEYLSKEQIEEEIEIVKNIFLKTSPIQNKQLHKNLSLEIEKILSNINDSTELESYIRTLSKLSFHTKFDNHFNIKSNKGVPLDNIFFPYPIMKYDNRLFINFRDNNIDFGTEIVSINNIKSSEVYTNLKKYKDVFQIAFYREYGGFEKFDIELKSLTNKNISIPSINVLDLTKIHNRRVFKKFKKRDHVLINYYKKIDSYYIQINNFDYKQNGTTSKFLDDVFTDISVTESKNLIIDLRYNLGGRKSNVTNLYSYLCKDTCTIEVAQIINNDTIPYIKYLKSFNKCTDSISKICKLYGEFVREYKRENNQFSQYFRSKIKPKQNSFNGNLYILLSEDTFSAALFLPLISKRFDRATIIGQKSKSSHHNMTGGIQIEYELPYSKASMIIPLVWNKFSKEIMLATPQKHLTPDITIPDSVRIKYILQGKDPELEETLKLIDQKQSYK
jgi:hypothetical protein